MLVPYLRRLAGESRIIATSAYRKLNGKDTGQRSVVLELDLEDATEVEPEAIASMLEKFLKHVTGDAGAAGTFDIFKVESREPPERTDSRGPSWPPRRHPGGHRTFAYALDRYRRCRVPQGLSFLGLPPRRSEPPSAPPRGRAPSLRARRDPTLRARGRLGRRTSAALVHGVECATPWKVGHGLRLPPR